MKTEFACGRLGTQSVDDIAWRAASALVGRATPWAVCVAPEGRVTLERPSSAAESDLVGVFTAHDGLLGASRRIRDELVEWIRIHGLPPPGRRRVTVNARRRAA